MNSHRKKKLSVEKIKILFKKNEKFLQKFLGSSLQKQNRVCSKNKKLPKNKMFTFSHDIKKLGNPG